MKNLTVNFHLTKACNMRCKFCYATFSDLGKVKHDRENSVKIIHELANAGFGKITFAGGEPTLVKELPELVKLAKSLGMTTCVVTNGSQLLNDGYTELLVKNLDWLALSIDSLQNLTNIASGRHLFNSGILDNEYFEQVIAIYRGHGVKIKINTVVSKFNLNEDLNAFILRNNPQRWKVLQSLPVDGQNSDFSGQFEISKEEFNEFIRRHEPVSERITIVTEENQAMRGSYLMVSPDGSFFDSTKGYHSYSQPILEIGVQQALRQISFDPQKFLNRGGFYNW